jgi:hypothetical protein
MKNTPTIMVLICFFLTACSTAPPLIDPQAVNHMINIDRNGNFVQVGEGEKVNFTVNENQRDKAFQEAIISEKHATLLEEPSLEKHWQVLEAALRDHAVDHGGRIKIMLYFHGGLNSERHSLQRVQSQYRQVLNETDMYPIFVNWRSGPIDSYFRHLTRIRQAKKSNSAKFTSPFYLASDLLASLAYAPKSWVVQGKHSWDSTVQREPDYWEDYLSSGFPVIHTGDAENYADPFRSLLWVVTSPAKIVSTPFTYTLSKPAWDIMIRRTETMFVKPNEFHNPPARHGSSYCGAGALSVFLDHLVKFQTQPGIKLEIILFGHSMGAIICNEIVQAFPELNITTIVHMASADSIRNFLGKTVRFMQAHTDTRVYSLYLSPENEDREISSYGLTPSGSLLTWIDNSFTTPATELDRRAGRWSNMRRALFLIPDPVVQRLHFKIFGQGVGPQVHGAFDDFPYWQESFYWR